MTPEKQQALDILYRAYEDVAHDHHLTIWENISTRRTLFHAIRYLTAPEHAVVRDWVLNTNRRRRRAR